MTRPSRKAPPGEPEVHPLPPRSLEDRIAEAVRLAQEDGAPFDGRLAGWIRANCVVSSENTVFALMLAMQAHAAVTASSAARLALGATLEAP